MSETAQHIFRTINGKVACPTCGNVLEEINKKNLECRRVDLTGSSVIDWIKSHQAQQHEPILIDIRPPYRWWRLICATCDKTHRPNKDEVENLLASVGIKDVEKGKGLTLDQTGKMKPTTNGVPK